MNRIVKRALWAFPVVLMLASCGAEEREERVDVFSTLRDVSRLELSRMTVGKVGMISDPSLSEAGSLADKARAAFSLMKVGTRIGVYSYDTYMTAYVDLSELRPEDVAVDNESRTARVVLPPVRVSTDGREPQLHEEHYRVTGLRSSIMPSERARLKAQMASEVRKEMASNSAAAVQLKRSAEEKGRAWIETLLENCGYEATVSFREF